MTARIRLALEPLEARLALSCAGGLSHFATGISNGHGHVPHFPTPPACPPPSAPDYVGPDVSSGPAPTDPASGGSDTSNDGTLPVPPAGITTADFVL